MLGEYSLSHKEGWTAPKGGLQHSSGADSTICLAEEDEPSFDPLSLHPVIRRYVSAADRVELLVDRMPQVKTWCVTTGSRKSVVKFSPMNRFMESPQQFAAEIKAAFLLSDDANSGDAAALLAVPLQTIHDPALGVFTITPYAGVDASRMRATEWKGHTPQQMEGLCKNLAASLLLTQLMHLRCGIMHHDIKLDNITYNKEHNFFVLIDYGACCQVDLSDWFSVRDLRYLDCGMGYYNPDTGSYAALESEGLLATTFPSLDIYLTGLAIAELFAGCLPAELDLAQYKGDQGAYLRAVYDFCWSTSPEAAAMPELMRSLLLQLLAPLPEDRISVTEALKHPWLEEEVPRLLAALEAAAPGWTHMLQQLRQDMTGNSSRSSTHFERSTSYCSSSSVDSRDSNGDGSFTDSTKSSAQSPDTPAGGSSPKPSISSSAPISRSSSCSSLDHASASGVEAESAVPAASSTAAAGVGAQAAVPAASTAASGPAAAAHVMLLVSPEAQQPVLAETKTTTATAVQVDVAAEAKDTTETAVQVDITIEAEESTETAVQVDVTAGAKDTAASGVQVNSDAIAEVHQACQGGRAQQQHHPAAQEGKHRGKVTLPGCFAGLFRRRHHATAAAPRNSSPSSSKNVGRQVKGVIGKLCNVLSRLRLKKTSSRGDSREPHGVKGSSEGDTGGITPQ